MAEPWRDPDYFRQVRVDHELGHRRVAQRLRPRSGCTSRRLRADRPTRGASISLALSMTCTATITTGRRHPQRRSIQVSMGRDAGRLRQCSHDRTRKRRRVPASAGFSLHAPARSRTWTLTPLPAQPSICRTDDDPHLSSTPWLRSQTRVLSISPGSSWRSRSTASRTSSASTSGEACSSRPSRP